MNIIKAVLRNRITGLLARLCDGIVFVYGRVLVNARAAYLFPGSDVVFDTTTRFKYPERIQMGQRIMIGPEVVIGAMGGINMGDDVRLSRGVILETATLDLSATLPYPHNAKPIVLEPGVWVGTNAIVLSGVRVGQGAVIGAGSVVTRDVAPSSVVAGNPAREISKTPKNQGVQNA